MNITLPPGRYFIGDPGYCFGTDWNDVNGICDTILADGRVFKDYQFFAAHTAHGDGGYRGSNGFEFGVDTGMLGAMPLQLATIKSTHGVVLDAPAGLQCIENDGCFKFNNIATNESIIIDTDPRIEDESSDDFNEEEEE